MYVLHSLMLSSCVHVHMLQAGMKPLIIACTEGFERLVILLLENNADVNIQDHVSYCMCYIVMCMCTCMHGVM